MWREAGALQPSGNHRHPIDTFTLIAHPSPTPNASRATNLNTLHATPHHIPMQDTTRIAPATHVSSRRCNILDTLSIGTHTSSAYRTMLLSYRLPPKRSRQKFSITERSMFKASDRSQSHASNSRYEPEATQRSVYRRKIHSRVDNSRHDLGSLDAPNVAYAG
jgi:hypothetical protein